MAKLRLPAAIDPHVHFRDPGGTHKETFFTGTSAALAGGYACVLDMPNNQPPVTDFEGLAAKQEAARLAVCDYGFWWGATASNKATFQEAARRCVGMKIYMSHTYGPLLVEDPAALIGIFRSWPDSRPIAMHAEGSALLAALLLGRLYDKRVHVCHISEAWQIAAIRVAKEKGFRVSCEVTPHHLFLTEKDADRLGSLAQMRPPLGTAQDRTALWDNLNVIDMLATDHAPHTLEEKRSPNPPPGVPGLETALPLMLTAVEEGRLRLEKLVDMIHRAPKRLFGPAAWPEAHTVVETGIHTEIRAADFQSRSQWSPFDGMPVKARVLETWIRGRQAWGDGEVKANPGSGRNILEISDPQLNSTRR